MAQLGLRKGHHPGWTQSDDPLKGISLYLKEIQSVSDPISVVETLQCEFWRQKGDEGENVSILSEPKWSLADSQLENSHLSPTIPRH